MDNLRLTLEVLFREIDPEMILKRHFSIRGNHEPEDKHWFINAYEALKDGHNKDEIEAIGQILERKWSKGQNAYSFEERESNVFNVLSYFTRKVLTEEEGEPVCEFEELLRWRELSMKLGEDMLTTSYFADKDNVDSRHRTFFSWRPVIRTNNRCLQELLSKGLTELHFHLKGSSFQFELSWLSLMNHIAGRGKEFTHFSSFRSPHVSFDTTRTEKSLYFLCMKAAMIRAILFRSVTDTMNQIPEQLITDILKAESENEIRMYQSQLQQEITRLRYFHGHRFKKECIDYAIPESLEERVSKAAYRGTVVFHGERWLMYSIFKALYRQEKKFLPLSLLFHAYLIIKERLRSELVQVNPYVGFRNFAEYQDRKEWFIPQHSIYETLLSSMAINATMSDQPLNYLEARIVPASTKPGLLEQICHYDTMINDQRFLNGRKNNYFYLFHFVKHNPGQANPSPYSEDVQPRHWALRQWVKQQTFAINQLRQMSTDLKNRMVGIDAASSEIGFRPEIFAQAYRYLKGYSCEMKDKFLKASAFPSLGFTYHAGEDFLDLADGLRAIDETIRFLEFRKGDRLGHALALGVNAEEYYQLKHKRVIIPKQDFLDNTVWLLEQIQYYGITCPQSLTNQLTKWYHRLYAEIYDSISDVIENPDHSIYYNSLLLRGDDPWLYFNDRIFKGEHNSFNPVTFWNRVGRRTSPEAEIARGNATARKLYQEYHFNYQVKKLGSIHEEFDIPDDYIRLIEALQQKMRWELAKKHIAIETNPTSNQLIGSYKRYAEHPILKFFNLDLENPAEPENNCAQLSVSLNTDDQGVFATYLENEYALMAIALEKEKDEKGNPRYTPRMIYDWLDRVRLMGFEQAFGNIQKHTQG